MTQKSSIFDMIGPVMIGPSSSHTAGVVKIALVAYSFLGGKPDSVTITFYNSFARTYEGHGSDRAVIGGLLGFSTDDARIKNALDEAEKEGLEFFFKSVGNASTMHPNTVKIQAKKGSLEVEIVGESLGGGVINIASYNGFRADFSASMHTLVIKNQDVPGSIAFIAQVLAQDGCNIATMNVSRKGKNDIACQFIEIDSELVPITIEYLRHLEWIHDVIYIPYAK
ncbi:L-serine dehydratase, iron-sulfur-dependent subunit beta [marine bacterium AO1-C]|nr:L-serine dehydratase, iron-sulfur-dependent subunit beta [marine bacterium AO1-C]